MTSLCWIGLRKPIVTIGLSKLFTYSKRSGDPTKLIGEGANGFKNGKGQVKTGIIGSMSKEPTVGQTKTDMVWSQLDCRQ